jgi:hypothetical protein
MEKELQIKSSVTIEMIGDPDRFPEAFEVKLTDEELEALPAQTKMQSPQLNNLKQI